MPGPFKLSKDDLEPLAIGYGACIASDRITVDGLPVRFMYREDPDEEIDSGWRFLSGQEDEAYLNDPDHFAMYDVNTIANYDPSILALLESPTGSAFRKEEGADAFVAVDDEEGPEA